MAKTAANAPVTVVPGGDSYLNGMRTKELCSRALQARPDAELIELDATSADQYAFDEAVSPSLLSDTAVVKIINLQNADEKFAETWSPTPNRRPKTRTAPASSFVSMKAALRGARSSIS